MLPHQDGIILKVKKQGTNKISRYLEMNPLPNNPLIKEETPQRVRKHCELGGWSRALPLSVAGRPTVVAGPGPSGFVTQSPVSRETA